MSILVDRFRASVSKLKDFRMKSESEFAVSYPTGFLNFDFVNGTVVHVKTDSLDVRYYSVGIQDGSMVMIIGRSGCGKTTWAMQTAANIVRRFATSAIFHDDIEGGITDTRKETLTKFYGEELKAKYISRGTGITAENFYERVKMIHDEKIENRSDYEYDTGLFDTSGNRIFKLEPIFLEGKDRPKHQMCRFEPEGSSLQPDYIETLLKYEDGKKLEPMILRPMINYIFTDDDEAAKKAYQKAQSKYKY